MSLPGFFSARLSSLASTYQFHLAPAVGILASALVLHFVFKYVAPNPPPEKKGANSLELPETVLLLAFVAMPVFVFLLARVTGAPCLNRYSISCVIGFGSLLGILASKRPAVGLGVLFLLCAQIGVNHFDFVHGEVISEPITSTPLSTKAEEFAQPYAMLAALPDQNSPIVALDALECLPLIHYAPAKFAARMLFLGDRLKCAATDGYGFQVWRLLHLPGRFESFKAFLSAHDRFLVLCGPRSVLQLQEFVDAGTALRVESVSPPGKNILLSIAVKN